MTCCSRTKEIDNIDQALLIFCAAHHFNIPNNDLNLEEYYDYYCRDCEKCRTDIRDFINEKLPNIDTIMENIDNKNVSYEELETLFKDFSISFDNMISITYIYKGRIQELYKHYTFMQYVSECFSLKLCKCSSDVDSNSRYCSLKCFVEQLRPNCHRDDEEKIITQILDENTFV